MSSATERLEPALRSNADALLAYLERRIGPDDAPDALAEVMTVAWRRERDLPAESDQARMWLYGIARNVLANAHRSRVRRHRLAHRLRILASAAPSAAADDGAEVRSAIAALDPGLAEIVRLRHWEGFSLAEIAQILDEPASTVRSRYSRAREQLAAALGEPTEAASSSRVRS
ncbi:RNA polymerase sigma factor [Demequina activiva]|uniref:DNA-directed RNA polymerase sigma-70 factor n=1 Tax=Demequina activiva TaxID=1582364 RepID=A0A919Q035_9MICO|nr:RNA polymerase sigma factor [Demequina activiva]GIG53539.1 DNA-directed RNA polymerase sigma-70 factor [Demequina activiva]